MVRRSITVRVPGRGTVRADYKVGATTVSLTFGYSDSPYESIQIWDPDVRKVVVAWVKEMDGDPSWPTWYEDILAATEA